MGRILEIHIRRLEKLKTLREEAAHLQKEALDVSSRSYSRLTVNSEPIRLAYPKLCDRVVGGSFSSRASTNPTNVSLLRIV